MGSILVIEDDHDMLKNIQEILESQGYPVLTAANGEQGFRVAWQELPDLILCDIKMPGLDGYGVLALLRNDPRTMTLPFLFLTALQQRVDYRKGMQLGADDFITKPFSRQELLEAVRVRLEKRQHLLQSAHQRVEFWQTNIMRYLPGEIIAPMSTGLELLDAIRAAPNDQAAPHIKEAAYQLRLIGLEVIRIIQNYQFLNELEKIQKEQPENGTQPDPLTQSVLEVASITANTQAELRDRTADLHLSIEDAQLAVREDFFERVVSEIVDAGFRFSQKGLPVRVEGWVNQERAVYCFKVTNQGFGMTPEQIRAMQDFGISDPSIDQAIVSSTGFFVTMRLLELCHATINMTSKYNEETSAELTFPLKGAGHV